MYTYAPFLHQCGMANCGGSPLQVSLVSVQQGLLLLPDGVMFRCDPQRGCRDKLNHVFLTCHVKSRHVYFNEPEYFCGRFDGALFVGAFYLQKCVPGTPNNILCLVLPTCTTAIPHLENLHCAGISAS